MAFEQRDNSGALFKNSRKEKVTHPDYRGPCMVGGVELEVSAWLKTSGNGTKYMSLSFGEKWEPNQVTARPAQVNDQQGPHNDDLDSEEIPF